MEMRLIINTFNSYERGIIIYRAHKAVVIVSVLRRYPPISAAVFF